MSKVLISESNLTGIADAIRYKKSSQDTYKPSEMAEAIESIDTGGGGGSSEEKNVNFYDYDGTIVNSYTKSEFLALESMPSNPSHSGLTAQGWNWSLADAKTYVTSHDYLNIGQMYVTDNGETRIYITLDDDDRLNPYLGIGVNGTVTVDWGDGNTQTITGTSINTLTSTQHTYSTGGDYVIRISGGQIGIIGASPWGSRLLWFNSSGNIIKGHVSGIIKIELGNNITSIGANAFRNCYCLKSITIPSGVTSIDNYAFYSCHSLQSITIPDTVTSISGSAFYSCHSLQSVTIPSGVTSIDNYAFSSCYSLQSITIPNTVTSIGANAFYSCYCLKSITIPDTVTSIGANAFNSCHSLQSVTIPSGVTSIGTNAFYSCSYAKYFDFSTHTSIPTLANKNAFSSIASDCKIIVPDDLYDDWKAATNWSTYASYIVKESDYNA